MHAVNQREFLLTLSVIIGSTVAVTMQNDPGILEITTKTMSHIAPKQDLQEYFNRVLTSFTKRETNISTITDRFSADLQTLLVSRTKLLNNIKDTARQSIDGFVYDPNLQPYNYYNRRHKPPNPVELVTRFSPEVKVNLNRSHVQCSTEIFVNSSTVLNMAKATEPIDEAFRRNYKEESSLLWQFFCSVVGTHRSYPGKK